MAGNDNPLGIDPALYEHLKQEMATKPSLNAAVAAGAIDERPGAEDLLDAEDVDKLVLALARARGSREFRASDANTVLRWARLTLVSSAALAMILDGVLLVDVDKDGDTLLFRELEGAVEKSEAVTRADDAGVGDALQAAIGEWADKTFPSHAVTGARGPIYHLREEADELIKAWEAGDHARIAVETADVGILAATVAHLERFGLYAAILDKMAINRARVWGTPDANGIVHHVESSQPEPVEKEKGTGC